MSAIYFSNTANTGNGSLRAALAAASAGDVVEPDPDVFGAGELVEITVSSSLAASVAATLKGGATRLRIKGSSDDMQTLFSIADSCASFAVEDVEFYGRVITRAPNTVFRRCLFGGNLANVNGVRAYSGADVALYDCLVVGFVSAGYGAAVDAGAPTIVRSTIAGNGAASSIPSDATVVDSIVDPDVATAGFVVPPSSETSWSEWNLRLLPTSPYATGATTAAGARDLDGKARGRRENGATVYALGAYEIFDPTPKLHAWLEYAQTITVATATAKAYDVVAQSAARWKITKGLIMASQYYNRGETPVFFARVEDSESGTIVAKADVASISYTAYKVSTSWSTEKRTPVEGHEDVEIPLSAYLDALVDDDSRWTEDETGYNFVFEPDSTEDPIFPDGGKYVVVVTIQFEDANPAPISYEIEVK